VRQPVHAPYEISPKVAKRISWLPRRLLCWFARNGRSFPWRESGREPYEVVVAEILLQRTTAAGVARAYSGFIERYHSWIALAHTPLMDLENTLRPLGLWRQKALAIRHEGEGHCFEGRLVRPWANTRAVRARRATRKTPAPSAHRSRRCLLNVVIHFWLASALETPTSPSRSFQ
jgi:HhH-GPD superfamily base excision DNA repair protein